MYADVRTRWGVFFVGLRDVSREHRWAREDEVNFLRECGVGELCGDGADVHRKSRVSDMYGLRRKEMWELESQIRNAVRDNRVCARVCVDPSVRADYVANNE